MKIIVDKIPQRPDDCLFSEYQGDGYSTCILHCGQVCEVDRCEFLKATDGKETMKQYIALEDVNKPQAEVVTDVEICREFINKIYEIITADMEEKTKVLRIQEYIYIYLKLKRLSKQKWSKHERVL